MAFTTPVIYLRLFTEMHVGLAVPNVRYECLIKLLPSAHWVMWQDQEPDMSTAIGQGLQSDASSCDMQHAQWTVVWHTQRDLDDTFSYVVLVVLDSLFHLEDLMVPGDRQTMLSVLLFQLSLWEMVDYAGAVRVAYHVHRRPQSIPETGQQQWHHGHWTTFSEFVTEYLQIWLME